MPLSNTDIQTLTEALGEAHAELLERVRTVTSEDTAALDKAATEARTSASAAKAAEAKVAKLQKDLDARTGSEADTVKALQAQLDAATSASKAMEAKLTTTQKTGALFRAVLSEVGGDTARAGDVVALYQAEYGLEGLALEGEGKASKLTGHVENLAALKAGREYLFQSAKGGGGNGGGAPGADRNQGGGGGGGKAQTPAEKAAAQGQALAASYLDRSKDPLAALYPPRQGQQQGQQQQGPQVGIIPLPGNAASL